RFVWDLTHDGADTIPGAKVDSGNPGTSIPVAPGKYVIRITIGKQTQGQTVEVATDPRQWSALVDRIRADDRTAEAERLKRSPVRGNGNSFAPFGTNGANEGEVQKMLDHSADELKLGPIKQEEFALKVRDHIQQLTDTVVRLRAVQKQIGVRKDLFKDDKAA